MGAELYSIDRKTDSVQIACIWWNIAKCIEFIKKEANSWNEKHWKDEEE